MDKEDLEDQEDLVGQVDLVVPGQDLLVAQVDPGEGLMEDLLGDLGDLQVLRKLEDQVDQKAPGDREDQEDLVVPMVLVVLGPWKDLAPDVDLEHEQRPVLVPVGYVQCICKP